MTFPHGQKYFDITDFVIFAITIIIPISIGIYGFIFKKKPKTISEYLVGNRNMQFFPVVMSLTASVISGSYTIGPVSEVYFYGIQYILRSIVIIIASYCFATLYLPPFYNLKITSTFEYLQVRFDYKVRLLGSILFVIKTVLYMAVWVYAPTVMFEQVTGMDLNFIIPICSVICIFYTFVSQINYGHFSACVKNLISQKNKKWKQTSPIRLMTSVVQLTPVIPFNDGFSSFEEHKCKGGVRNVIWADTFQMIAMLLGIIIIIIVGVYDVGGVEKIWTISQQGKRLRAFDFDPNPRLRHSFWILIVGIGTATLASITASQFVVQRCVSLSTLVKSKVAVMVQSGISAAILFLACCLGLILYAAFHDCDPISTKTISKPDQLLPHYIMNLKDRIPGLPSVVISVAFCSALSSISSGLNSTSGVILIDFIQPLSKRPITDAQGSFYMKITTIVIGVLFTGITYTLSNMNNVIQITVSLTSITLGTSLGIFTLGVLLPWANANGAFSGGIAGGLIIAWMSIGSQVASAGKKRMYSTLPLSTENCGNSTAIMTFANQTLRIASNSDVDEPFFLYAVSFYYYSMIGALTAIVVGMIVSFFTGFNKPKDMDRKLFSPAIHKYLKKEITCETTDMMKN